MVERIRAAGAGIAAFYTRTGVGTNLAEGKEDGQEHLLEYPLHADYAFTRAHRVDTFGNIQFRLTQRNFNLIMAMAAKVTKAEVEQLNLPATARDVAKLVMTSLGLFEVTPDGFVLREITPGHTPAEVQEQTVAHLIISSELKDVEV